MGNYQAITTIKGRNTKKEKGKLLSITQLLSNQRIESNSPLSEIKDTTFTRNSLKQFIQSNNENGKLLIFIEIKKGSQNFYLNLTSQTSKSKSMSEKELNTSQKQNFEPSQSSTQTDEERKLQEYSSKIRRQIRESIEKGRKLLASEWTRQSLLVNSWFN